MVNYSDAKEFKEAATALLASFEHLEAKVPGGQGSFNPDNHAAYKAANDRVGQLLDRFRERYDLNSVFFRGYQFLIVPTPGKPQLMVVPESMVATMRELPDSTEFLMGPPEGRREEPKR